MDGSAPHDRRWPPPSADVSVADAAPAGAAMVAVVRARLFRPDAAVVIIGCVIFVFVLFLSPILNDGDTLWQIRTGDWILDHRAIPAIDPFSFTAGDRPWFAHEWLAETLLALAFRIAGMQGVMALAAAATGLTAALLLRDLRRFLPAVYAVLGVALALADAAPSMLARPHLLAWPCLVLWCGGLVTARARRTAPSLMLMPVMVLWVNLHGSFMLGLLLPIALMVEAVLDVGADRRRAMIDWGRFILAAWAVALLNPDFAAGVIFPIRMVGMASLARIGEWAPASFGGLQPLELTILAGLALGFTGQVRLPPIRLLIFLALVHGALAHVRHGQILGLVGALILAEPFGTSLGRGPASASGVIWRRAAACAAMLAVAALAVRIALPLGPDGTGGDFAATLERIPPSLRARPVLNAYALGGELIFNGVRPFIDGRADLYGDAFMARYGTIVAPNRTELERALSEYGIGWTIFRADDPVVQVLDTEPGWRRLITSNGLVIHARDNQVPRRSAADDGARVQHMPGLAS